MRHTSTVRAMLTSFHFGIWCWNITKQFRFVLPGVRGTFKQGHILMCLNFAGALRIQSASLASIPTFLGDLGGSFVVI